MPLLCAAVPARNRRPAFTMMELMVAMFILAILASIGVYVVQNINNDAGAPRGAVVLQQELMIARQNALRSQRNSGVRLIVPSGSTLVTTLQRIQQPEDFAVQAAVGATAPFLAVYSPDLTNLALVDLVGAPPFGGFSGNVQVGDYLVINDGLPHRVAGVTNTRLILASALRTALPLPGTTNYLIKRAPRLTGEDAIQLPVNIAIDIDTNLKNTNNNPAWVAQPLPGQGGIIDIVFAPSGAVVGSNLPAVDALYLWVRDSTLPLFQGDNTIVTVYTRTGLVAAHPVNSTTGADAYSFTKTGVASGN